MKFTQAAGLERGKRSGNRLANGKVGRVNLAKLAAGAANFLRRMLQRAVHKGAIATGDGRDCAGDIVRAHRCIDNVRVRRGDISKERLVDAKILGQDVARSVCQPVVNVERCPAY